MSIKSIINEESFLKFLFYYFKIVGLATMRLNPKRVGNAKKLHSMFASSKPGVAYNALLICLLIVSLGFFLETIYSFFAIQSFSDEISKAKTEFSMATLQTLLHFFISMVVPLTHCCRHSSLVSLANRMNRIRESAMSFSSANPSIARQSLTGKIIKAVCFNFVTWLLLGILIIVMNYPLYEALRNGVVTCSLIMSANFLQYLAVLKIIEQILERVNDNLIDLLGESVRVLEIVSGSRNHLNVKVNKLTQLQKLHSALCKISNEISDSYSLSMLLSITYIFLNTIHVLYYVGKALVLGQILMNWVMYLYNFFYASLFFSLLAMLTNSVNTIISESKKTGEIVSDCILINHSKEILEKLNNFSLGLLHKQINFTVYGFFSLEKSLIISITGSIATYLVIILQFQDK